MVGIMQSQNLVVSDSVHELIHVVLQVCIGT